MMAKKMGTTMEQAMKLLRDRVKLPDSVFSEMKPEEICEFIVADPTVSTYHKKSSLNLNTLKQYVRTEKSNRGLTRPKGTGTGKAATAKAPSASLDLRESFAYIDKIKNADIMPLELLQLKEKLKDNRLDFETAITALVTVANAKEELETQRQKFLELFPEEKPTRKAR